MFSESPALFKEFSVENQKGNYIMRQTRGNRLSNLGVLDTSVPRYSPGVVPGSYMSPAPSIAAVATNRRFDYGRQLQQLCRSIASGRTLHRSLESRGVSGEAHGSFAQGYYSSSTEKQDADNDDGKLDFERELGRSVPQRSRNREQGGIWERNSTYVRGLKEAVEMIKERQKLREKQKERLRSLIPISKYDREQRKWRNEESLLRDLNREERSDRKKLYELLENLRDVRHFEDSDVAFSNSKECSGPSSPINIECEDTVYNARRIALYGIISEEAADREIIEKSQQSKRRTLQITASAEAHLLQRDLERKTQEKLHRRTEQDFLKRESVARSLSAHRTPDDYSSIKKVQSSHEKNETYSPSCVKKNDDLPRSLNQVEGHLLQNSVEKTPRNSPDTSRIDSLLRVAKNYTEEEKRERNITLEAVRRAWDLENRLARQELERAAFVREHMGSHWVNDSSTHQANDSSSARNNLSAAHSDESWSLVEGKVKILENRITEEAEARQAHELQLRRMTEEALQRARDLENRLAEGLLAPPLRSLSRDDFNRTEIWAREDAKSRASVLEAQLAREAQERQMEQERIRRATEEALSRARRVEELLAKYEKSTKSYTLSPPGIRDVPDLNLPQLQVRGAQESFVDIEHDTSTEARLMNSQDEKSEPRVCNNISAVNHYVDAEPVVNRTEHISHMVPEGLENSLAVSSIALDSVEENAKEWRKESQFYSFDYAEKKQGQQVLVHPVRTLPEIEKEVVSLEVSSLKHPNTQESSFLTTTVFNAESISPYLPHPITNSTTGTLSNRGTVKLEERRILDEETIELKEKAKALEVEVHDELARQEDRRSDIEKACFCELHRLLEVYVITAEQLMRSRIDMEAFEGVNELYNIHQREWAVLLERKRADSTRETQRMSLFAQEELERGILAADEADKYFKFYEFENEESSSIRRYLLYRADSALESSHLEEERGRSSLCFEENLEWMRTVEIFEQKRHEIEIWLNNRHEVLIKKIIELVSFESQVRIDLENESMRTCKTFEEKMIADRLEIEEEEKIIKLHTAAVASELLKELTDETVKEAIEKIIIDLNADIKAETVNETYYREVIITEEQEEVSVLLENFKQGAIFLKEASTSVLDESTHSLHEDVDNESVVDSLAEVDNTSLVDTKQVENMVEDDDKVSSLLPDTPHHSHSTDYSVERSEEAEFSESKKDFGIPTQESIPFSEYSDDVVKGYIAAMTAVADEFVDECIAEVAEELCKNNKSDKTIQSGSSTSVRSRNGSPSERLETEEFTTGAQADDADQTSSVPSSVSGTSLFRSSKDSSSEGDSIVVFGEVSPLKQGSTIRHSEPEAVAVSPEPEEKKKYTSLRITRAIENIVNHFITKMPVFLLPRSVPEIVEAIVSEPQGILDSSIEELSELPVAAKGPRPMNWECLPEELLENAKFIIDMKNEKPTLLLSCAEFIASSIVEEIAILKCDKIARLLRFGNVATSTCKAAEIHSYDGLVLYNPLLYSADTFCGYDSKNTGLSWKAFSRGFPKDTISFALLGILELYDFGLGKELPICPPILLHELSRSYNFPLHGSSNSLIEMEAVDALTSEILSNELANSTKWLLENLKLRAVDCA